jgi:regulator of nonsense transcripts 3
MACSAENLEPYYFRLGDRSVLSLKLMSPEMIPPPKGKHAKEKETRDRLSLSQSSATTTTERLKTVVRRLPPNLPEEVFWQSVQAWVSEDTVNWKMFYSGKVGKRFALFYSTFLGWPSYSDNRVVRLNKENIPSRAYIAFKNEELLATFSREYDGHLFKDKSGPIQLAY